MLFFEGFQPKSFLCWSYVLQNLLSSRDTMSLPVNAKITPDVYNSL